jgi:hypothetical protein
MSSPQSIQTLAAECVSRSVCVMADLIAMKAVGSPSGRIDVPIPESQVFVAVTRVPGTLYLGSPPVQVRRAAPCFEPFTLVGLLKATHCITQALAGLALLPICFSGC